MNSSPIRPLTRADLAAVGAIADATDLFPSAMLPDMAAPFLSGDSQDIWCVFDAGAVTAFGYCVPEPLTDGTWNLLALAVDPAHQGKGQGRAIMEWVEQNLRSHGARLMLVDTADIPAFQPQHRFYASFGMIQTAHIPQFYDADTGKYTFVKTLTR